MNATRSRFSVTLPPDISVTRLLYLQKEPALEITRSNDPCRCQGQVTSVIFSATSVICGDKYTYQYQNRMERRTLPIWCLHQLCNTRVRVTMNQDCDSSFLLLSDSRQETGHQLSYASEV